MTLALDKRNYDLWMQLSAPQDVTARHVALVAIDARSLADPDLGPWPWPSERIARLIAAVAEARPAAVGLDILLHQRRDESDGELARVLATHPEVLLVAALRGLGDADGDPAVEWPLPEFVSGRRGRVGFGNFIEDRPDGVIRSFRQAVETRSGLMLSFPTLVALAATGTPREKAHVGGHRISMPDHAGTVRRWPLTTWIDYRRPGQVPVFSASDVLGGQVDAAGLQGKAVLIGGVGSVEFADLFRTPFSDDLVTGLTGPMHGVEIQANAVETLLLGEHARETPPLLACAVVLLFVVVTCYALRPLRPFPGALGAAGLVLLVAAGSLSVFSQCRIQLPVTPFALGAAAAYAMVALEKYAAAEDRRRREEAVFQTLEFYRSRVFHKMGSQIMLARYAIEDAAATTGGQGGTTGPQPLESGLRHLDVLSDYLENINLADIIRYEEAAPRREVVDLAAIVRGAHRDYWRACENVGLLLVTQTPEHGVWVLADPGQLRAAFGTLVENTLKYVPPHGSRVDLVSRAEEGNGVLEVLDDGPGIPEEALSHLFEPFYRAGSGRASQVKGMGLGLFIAKSIVERHGGRIEVESTAGHGTIFRVRVPLTDRPPGTGE